MKNTNKTLFLGRGVPGSGKSTTLRKLLPVENIFSTDDYWGPKYCFDVNALGTAHRWNQVRVINAMQEGKSPIAVDNTNTTWKEIEPYAIAAISNGYTIEIVEPLSPWWKKITDALKNHNVSELDVWAEFLAKKNIHKVPLDTIKKMLGRWQSTGQIEMHIDHLKKR